jgi:hypothetical protein
VTGPADDIGHLLVLNFKDNLDFLDILYGRYIVDITK